MTALYIIVSLLALARMAGDLWRLLDRERDRERAIERLLHHERTRA